jgi:hypothetical protein
MPFVRKVLFPVLFVLALFEGSSRAFLSVDSLFKRVAGGDEASWRLRWLRQAHRDERVSYGFDRFDPQRGWALKPGLRDLRVFADKTLNSDRFGLRGARDHSDFPGRAVRILVLGDSFTFGEGVSDDETYSAFLEASLPDVEVLNGGVHGYGHDQMLLALEDLGPKVHPDLVLLGFVSEDMERNLLAFRDFAKPRFALEGDALVLENVPVPSPEDVERQGPFRSRFLDLLRMLRDRYETRSGVSEQRMTTLTYRLLLEIAQVTKSLGARPVFCYLPVFGEIDKPDNSMTRREHAFFSFCRNNGIQSMYLRRFFLEKIKAGTRFKTTGHWGPEEHRTAALGIRAYLLEKDLLARSPREGRPEG